MAPQKEWFSEWFNSPYYHILYQNRDEKEAEFFLRNVVAKLNLTPEKRIVDLACGKGRHAIFLNNLGFDVTGVDLATKSIDYASQFENQHLRFEVQDLRCLHFESKFDAAFNLFTSFGYFKSLEEDQLVIQNIHSILNKNGLLLIDFMNIECVIEKLISNEQKTINNIHFTIHKWIEDGFIYKRIGVQDGNQQMEFTEKVQALQLGHFEQLLNTTHFTIQHVFGNYALDAFNPTGSDRLIIVAKKND
ncbi:MAG: methyltransferase domain-containing protein [Bacteroidia bacterium]|jgi:SAM-dependent methyltransferase|nr:methyltransferase domain-containing protein [Bacteroidia bacterium]